MNTAPKDIRQHMSTTGKTAKHYAQLAALGFMAAALTACAIPRDVPTQALGKSPTLDRFADLQSRLDKLGGGASAYAAPGESGDAAALTQNKYAWAKAQCWVRNAYSEQHENDARGFSAAALDEAQKITQSLEGKSAAYTDTALINHTERVRPDLWQRAESLKQQPGYACAAATVGCLEVQLSRSGHELADTGWRHANSYLAIAEDMAKRATSQADACKPPPPKPSIVPLPAPAAPVALPPVKTLEKITLNASALFRFDRRTQADLLPQGKAELDQLAARIQQVYASVDAIDLVGYTDRLGSDAYNQTLSQDRANTVKAYLQTKGVTATMSAQGRGESNPLVQCEGNAPTAKLTACLQPNRRVEVMITGIKK